MTVRYEVCDKRLHVVILTFIAAPRYIYTAHENCAYGCEPIYGDQWAAHGAIPVRLWRPYVPFQLQSGLNYASWRM